MLTYVIGQGAETSKYKAYPEDDDGEYIRIECDNVVDGAYAFSKACCAVNHDGLEAMIIILKMSGDFQSFICMANQATWDYGECGTYIELDYCT